MFPWKFVCVAAVVLVIVLVIKIAFLYQGLNEISRQLHDRLGEDTNNVIYVSGNDRHLKAFARQMNQELAILYGKRRKYQNGDKAIKEAVTNISHDLRTPLTAIYGYLELLDAEMETEAFEQKGRAPREHSQENPVTHYLAQIRNRADAMKELTEELFRYSILVSGHEEDAGKRQEEEDSQDKVILNRVLADCLLSCYDLFQKNQIEPQISIPDEEVVRFLNAGALKRVFHNILDNAVKYAGYENNNACDLSGHISEKGTEPWKKLRVALLSDGTITFQNSAENLDRVSVERLFDRFYTVETGRNSTGLGLSIAKLLTERMGGSISAEYTEGMLKITVKL